jgi:cytochrome c-type biogenesis protein
MSSFPRWFKHGISQFINVKLIIPVFLVLVTFILILLSKKFDFQPLFLPVQTFILTLQLQYDQWFSQQLKNPPIFLIPLSFLGGLVSSLSPCILSLLPVHLGYIGTREITSRKAAFQKAGFFVLGVATLLSLLGLFSSLAITVTLDYRGYIQVAIGLLILLMGLSLTGILHIPFPQFPLPFALTHPFGVGLTFALLSSPCSSPILFSVLAAGAATGSQLLSIITMISFTFGYTTVIFLASLFTGFAKQSRWLLRYSQAIISMAGMALILAGGYYLVEGWHWIEALKNNSIL